MIMTFFEAISNLYSGDSSKVETALLSSTFVNDLKTHPDFVYCTGFNFRRNLLFENGIDFFYDPMSQSLIHQCTSNNQSIPRYMGLVMWHEMVNEKHYYAPLLYDEKRSGYVSTFNNKYFLESNAFDDSIIILHTNGRIQNKNGPEYYMDISTTSDVVSIIKKKSDSFLFIFALGNLSSTINYPYRRFYTSWNDSKLTLKNLYRPCQRNIKIKTDSWEKLGKDELNQWDERHPGWSDGIFD